jgi:hypothetical protein
MLIDVGGSVNKKYSSSVQRNLVVCATFQRLPAMTTTESTSTSVHHGAGFSVRKCSEGGNNKKKGGGKKKVGVERIDTGDEKGDGGGKCRRCGAGVLGWCRSVAPGIGREG